MVGRIILLISLMAVIYSGTSNAALFFPEDETKLIKNFTGALPEGYDDPDIVYGRNKEQPKVIITNISPMEAKRNTEFDIGSRVHNLPKGAIVTAYYRTDPLNQYRALVMKEVIPGRYSVTIPKRFVDSDRLQYYVEATFAGNRLANSGDIANPHKVALIGSKGIPRFALFAVFAIGGIWLFSKINLKGSGKQKPVTKLKKI